MRKRKAASYVRRAVRRSLATLRAPIRGRKAVRRYKPGYSRIGGYYGRFFAGSPELKFLDTLLSGNIDATGEVAPGGGTSTGIVLIPQGVTESTRVGRKCTIRSILMRGTIDVASSASSAYCTIALVWDKQANGAYPAFTDVFATSTTYSHLNLANSGRFVILKRWHLAINQATYNDTGATFAGSRRVVKYYKKCNIPLEFSSTTGAITELKSNNLMVMWEGSGDDTVTANLNFRVRFSDD